MSGTKVGVVCYDDWSYEESNEWKQARVMMYRQSLDNGDYASWTDPEMLHNDNRSQLPCEDSRHPSLAVNYNNTTNNPNEYIGTAVWTHRRPDFPAGVQKPTFRFWEFATNEPSISYDILRQSGANEFVSVTGCSLGSIGNQNPWVHGA